MQIEYRKEERQFHLCNGRISYIFHVMENGQLGHLYFGKQIHTGKSYLYLQKQRSHCHTAYAYENNFCFSLDTVRQEYPAYGTTDFREPAYRISQRNGSHITDFVCCGHEIRPGKPKLSGLPATYAETEDEAETLIISLWDELLQVKMELLYTIFRDHDAIARSVRFANQGTETVFLDRAMSLSVDFFDSDFTMLQLDGTWARERYISERTLQKGIQSVGSLRGASSAVHNPFLALKRKNTTEYDGEAYGCSLIYSGNFLMQAEVDHYEVLRVMAGIHPSEFCWKLAPKESFQTPEAVMVYSCQGLNGMSQAFHELYNKRLVHGSWRERTRPILINNWEATYFDFNQDKLLEIARKAGELGAEMFVLDDGWFGERNNASQSLGDWTPNYDKLPDGIRGLAEKITAMGMKFGLWFEPEMVNRVSELYQKHPEWVVRTPNRRMSVGRNQYVLDYSNPEVVQYIGGLMEAILDDAPVSYIKWDMNRNITEAFGASLPADRQGEFFHRYILGVYSLYERLTEKYPEILFESCASGGGRFDPGMLYYAPQCWTSDDTDAVERIKIQYGTSLCYPVVSMGSHVSAVPNHQVGRVTGMDFRAAVAYFGTFGYELDVNMLTDAEQAQMKEQIAFFKKYREVIQLGRFYRLRSPFENQGDGAWMCVSRDKRTAILATYKVLARVNPRMKKLLLSGLDAETEYSVSGRKETYYGDELMNAGFVEELEFTGYNVRDNGTIIYDNGTDKGDFTAHIYVLEGR